MKTLINFLMEGAQDGTGAGASSGSVLTQGGTSQAAGAAGNPGLGSGQQESTNSQAGTQSAGGNQASDWKLALPKEIQSDPALGVIHDVAGLAKSYINAQKLVGADKIPVPSKHATEDDWKNVFHKLGLPQKAEDYKVTLPKDVTLDAEVLKQFQVAAHGAGVLPQQAGKLAEWFIKYNSEATSKIQESAKTAQAKGLEDLKKDWGQAFDKNVAIAQMVVKDFADDATFKYLDESGLGNDVNLIRFLSKIGSSMGEDKIKGAGITAQSVTPKDAKAQIDMVMKNKSHPYWDKEHTNHHAAVKEMQDLFNQAYTVS